MEYSRHNQTNLNIILCIKPTKYESYLMLYPNIKLTTHRILFWKQISPDTIKKYIA